MRCFVTGQMESDMNNVICVTSNNTVGCTFLDWSLHFLNGRTNYYRVDENQWIPLVDNPVATNGQNAHKHNKNHPEGLSGTVETITNIKKYYNRESLYSFFPYPKEIDDVLDEVLEDVWKDQSIKIINNSVEEKLAKLFQYQIDDYKNLISYCHTENVPVIYVHSDFKDVGYFWNRRNSTFKPPPGMVVGHLPELVAKFQETFFDKSIKTWQELNLNEIWDKRERLALNVRPYDTSKFFSVGFSNPSAMHWVNSPDLWHDTDDVLLDLMRLLDLTVADDRLKAWLPIMRNWQRIQSKNLKFYNNLDYLVECIVNGWHFHIDPLTFDQEVIIQHCLIYKYNLNLKTWGLEKFPDNAIKLHNLLEKNIHPVDKIY